MISTANGEVDWHTWQYALAALITIDIAGGVNANTLDQRNCTTTAKQRRQGP